MGKLTIAVAVVLAPVLSLAGGDSIPNINPRDLGLSGSAVAAQRDAAAVFANPAALARLEEGAHVALALSALDIAATWHAPVGPAEASTKFKLAPPGGAFVAYGATLWGTRVGFGAGFTVPYGGNVYWDEDWEGRFRVTTVDRKVFGTYANGAFQLTPYLRLGGGLIYYRTTEYLKQGLDFTGSEGYAEVSTEGGHLSYQLAFEIQPTEAIRIGFQYKHQAVQVLEGDAAFHGVPDSIRPSLPDQDVEHVLTIPSGLDVAAAWQARKDLLVTFTYSWDRYSVYKEDRFVGSAGTEVLVPRNYRNGYTVRGGAEYQLNPAIELRAGLQRDVSGMRSSTFSPSLPDASSWGGSVGASWHFRPNMSVSAAFFVAFMDEVKASGDAFAGTYDIRAEIFSVGFAWRPAAR
jgi:long-chain fatty acid transport protein